MGAHDSGYKKLFSFPTMVEDLLRGFVREQWVDDLDFRTLERKNTGFVSDDLREREDDIIWRVKWKNGDSWMYVYLLLEFQTEHDRFMGVRIMNYVSLLYQDLIQTGEIVGNTLPPVLPMVVYRGEQKWNAPLNVKDYIQNSPPGLSRYIPSLRYLLLEEVRMNEAELERMCNLAAEIFRIEKSATLKASVPPFLSFLQWTTKAGPQQDSLKRAVTVWFTRAQKPAKILNDGDAVEDMPMEEIEPMLSERIEKWSNELRAEGKAEGKAEGRVEGELKGKAEGELKGRTEMLLSLFQMKFGPVSDELRRRIESASDEEIRQICSRLLTADCLGDVLPH